MQTSQQDPKPLFSYRKYWAECFGVAEFLPTSRAEMDALGWDSCDVILVVGDAYVDHPSFGMAVVGRVLEAQGYRVGMIAQPDWRSKEPFMVLGEPNLFYGVSAGNMDSMINRYTADRRMRSDDAYTPGNVGGKRPDRAVTVYSQRCKEAYSHVPIVIGGIEASLRRLAHYDYWSDTVRRSVLHDSTADILVYGNAERALCEIAHRLAGGEVIDKMTDIRGTAFFCKELPATQSGQSWMEIDSVRMDAPGRVDPHLNPYIDTSKKQPDSCQQSEDEPELTQQVITVMPDVVATKADPATHYVRLPSFEKLRNDAVLYAHASRVFHRETNPGNARPIAQKHGLRELWVNPPPIPLETEEMDGVFDLPYKRVPHPMYGDDKIPAYDMIRFSVNIMRGCFGGCTFCSITEHEGRIIQSRSEESILREIEIMRDSVPGFTGTVSDLGGPTANMYRLNCKSKKIESNCRRPSCVYPTICKSLNTDHSPTTQLYRKARALPGVKRVAIASGLRYDLAIEDPEYVRELVTHHVGGYLKIAPEHTEQATLGKMMKPGMDSYYKFKKMFDKYSKEAGKEQYLIPYFIAAHPGTTDTEMMNLALWLKENKFRVDQVQNFYPSPMASATAMYHSERNPLHKVGYKTEEVYSAKTKKQRQLHKAFLRYHEPENWPALRAALKEMGRADLIGKGKDKLVPFEAPAEQGRRHSASGYQTARTQHNGVKATALPGKGRSASARAESKGAASKGTASKGTGPKRAASKSAAKNRGKSVGVKRGRR